MHSFLEEELYSESNSVAWTDEFHGKSPHYFLSSVESLSPTFVPFPCIVSLTQRSSERVFFRFYQMEWRRIKKLPKTLEHDAEKEEGIDGMAVW
jgi:hypothetical protein